MKPGPRRGHADVGRPEIIGHINEEALARGFVEAFEHACRTGIPVSRRADVRAYRGSTGTHIIATHAAVRARLTAEIAENERVRDNVLAAVSASHSPELVGKFVASAEKADALVARLRSELAELESSVAHISTEDSFETSTEVLAAAMRALLAGPRMTRVEADAFHRIVTDMRLEPIADGWRAQAYVRLLVADGLAVLGPITWEVAAERVGIGAMRANARERALPVLEAPETIEAMLVHEAHLSRPAAHVLASGPFPELAQVVLHARARKPVPDWVEPQWQEPAFVEHVVQVYCDPDFEWSKAYGRLSMAAQARVDCVAAAGELTLEQFRQRYPGAGSAQLFVTPTEQARVPPIYQGRSPVVVGASPDGVRCLRPVVCRCGRSATTLIRGPEVPGGLLCECGLAPFAAPGTLAAEVVFPADYQRMRVTPEAADRAMRRRYGRRGDPLTSIGPQEKTVLRALLSDPGRWWAINEVVDACDLKRQAALLYLRCLTRREFARHDEQLGQFQVIDTDDAYEVLARLSNRAK